MSTWMIVFSCFTDCSLLMVVIRLHMYLTDWFCRGSLFLKTPKFTIKFDLKLGRTNRKEDNLTD